MVVSTLLLAHPRKNHGTDTGDLRIVVSYLFLVNVVHGFILLGLIYNNMYFTDNIFDVFNTNIYRFHTIAMVVS